ncbi:MerR family transcriptional regulator [Microvirga tunisiensis]|uniref:MerR family transcriptional regulator n=2 Tax=Pannonibacter tanglangensis TaxID=2750084 RepID=A0A7X5J955_9HYPH|nr:MULTISPECIES: MerR family transcriptional regulator [unclassified Pannonibacter]NBN62511.1 MerR family transcriptional regulator [Pannonibacter sp. XCT-34]NBN78166.1 MerR family transcriptional regulator [Pannonibacter sp. XCT-53]
MSLEKSPDAFRTISEVAEDLDLPQHVLRFWETRFTQIKPLKRGGGRRYYRPDDVELLRGIRHLLYGEGYTIKGVQRILKEQGPRFVMQIWREDAIPLAAAVRMDLEDEDDDTPPQLTPPPRRTVVSEPVSTRSDAGHGLPSEVLPKGLLSDDDPRAPGNSQHRGGFRFMDRFRGDKAEGQAGGSGALSKDDVRKLQATLFELLECKRLLDQAR